MFSRVMLDLSVFDTELTADCFETVPFRSYDSGLGTLVTVGTYQYFPEESMRRGRIYLMSLQTDGTLCEKSRIDTVGILDMRWVGSGLTCALSNGSLQSYTLEGDQLALDGGPLEVDSSAIALSLDAAHASMFTGLNNGQVGLIDKDLELTTWKAHMCEVWCAALDRHDPHLAYTGSDDYMFALWDTRTTTRPSHKSTFHQAGVCSLASNPHEEHIFVSGSYDETCALWDKRALKAPLGTYQAKSGVWRLKWHPQRSDSLLAACMHDGFHVCNVDPTGAITNVASRPTSSIAYGCDWILQNGCGKGELCGGATFYNHEAIIWSPNA